MSDKERQILNNITCMWKLKIKQQKRNRLTDIENKLVVSSGEREGERAKIGIGD